MTRLEEDNHHNIKCIRTALEDLVKIQAIAVLAEHGALNDDQIGFLQKCAK